MALVTAFESNGPAFCIPIRPLGKSLRSKLTLLFIFGGARSLILKLYTDGIQQLRQATVLLGRRRPMSSVHYAS